MASNIKILDPVQGLIDYTNDIKPYHTKVIEALIEYVGTDSIEVSVFEDFNFEIGMLYEFDGNFVCLLGGYGTPSFGDPANILVLSPDVSKTILDFPAIGTGFFIVLGDKTTLFDPTVNVDLSIASSIEDRLVAVSASTGSPPAGGSFTVIGDKTAEYAPAVNFSIVGSTFNDGDYTVASTTTIGSPVTATQINVNQTVPTNNIEGFVSVQDATNTGTFSVIDSEYDTSLFVPHTTVFITGIALVPPTLTDDNQRFVSLVNTQPLVYNRILSYSKALRSYDVSSPAVPYIVADEGTVIAGIVNLTPTSFSVLGDFQSSNLFVGDEFYVEDSSGNDGTYNILSMIYEFDGTVNDFVTTFDVATVVDTNVDGNIKLNIPSNVFIIDSGDYTRFFVQGSRVNTTSGSHIGTYTTLNSKFINNKTYIRVRETLINEGTGRLILSTGANYISVDGDVTSIYGGSPAQQFNIVGSTRNDGSYTTASATYDVPSNTTQISIVEPFDITDASGEIFEFVSGDITHLPEGFGATLDLCELVPQALASTTFDEQFEILLGHKFIIDGTDSATNKIYIQDNENADVYNIFVNNTTGSPSDTLIEIISSGINNGTYNITSVVGGGSPAASLVELTVSGSPVLQDSGTFSGSPLINSGFLIYREWFQYFITNIDTGANDFIVAGDATSDITNGMIIQHLSPEAQYTVNAVPVFDGTNTTISVAEVITVGSPPVDGWIISI